MNFWRNSELFPPILCRLLARHRGGAPLDDQEIMRRGSLTHTEVKLISVQTDWRGVDLPTMRKFLTGCGIDFCCRRDMNRIKTYIGSEPNWLYLRKSPHWLSYYDRLLKVYLKSL